jgi:hypothetical protein
MTAALLDLLTDARVDAAHVTPETGLVCLSLWRPTGPARVVVGVGPRVVGLGLTARAPLHHAGARHPLVAALRAHVLGRFIRSATLDDDDGALWIDVGDAALTARVRFFPARHGEVRLTGATGEAILTWTGERLRVPRVCEPEGDLPSVGDDLVRVSDALAAELRRGALLKALRTLAKKLARRRDNVEGDLARLDDIPRLQRTGRLLLAQGAKIPRGATKATLEDWEEGGTLEVTLDPAVPAKQQAERFFHQAKRVQRGEAQMWARLSLMASAYDAVRALEAEVEAADAVTSDALTRWLDAARALGVRDQEATPDRGRAKEAPRVPFHEYVGWRGGRILVGRGAADNDALTLRVAKPHDLWMHARGATGAHVVVPLTRGSQCPQELLLDAATLAAHHSDARGSDFVEVTWTERRYVRKPRKSPPGRVTLDREKVLALRPEPERLARLLASRREV